ncbi:hypothetical protein PMI11_06629 [Rhizobium sp. CF142]|nr:hypothetical protein PMI11_06629 [Rhizobium sp. CF142]
MHWRFATRPTYAGHRTDDQKSANVGLSGLRYPAESFLSARRKLSGNETKPGCEISAAPEILHRWREGLYRQCDQRTHARHRLKSMRDSALPRQVHELLGLLLNPGCLLVYLSQKITALLPHEFRQVDLSPLNDRFNALDVSNALWNGLAIFIENSTQSVHQFRSLADNPLARPKQNRPSLLIRSFGRDETHLGLTGRDDDCFSIGGVVLLALHERADILRSDQPDLVPHFDQLTSPVMSATAGFHNHNRWRLFR